MGNVGGMFLPSMLWVQRETEGAQPPPARLRSLDRGMLMSCCPQVPAEVKDIVGKESFDSWAGRVECGSGGLASSGDPVSRITWAQSGVLDSCSLLEI